MLIDLYRFVDLEKAIREIQEQKGTDKEGVVLNRRENLAL